MSSSKKIPVNTVLYAQLAKISMTESEREEAIHALRLGDEIASAILWISDGIKRRFVNAAPKRGFKHEIAA